MNSAVQNPPGTLLPAAPSACRLEQLRRAVSVAQQGTKGLGDAALAREVNLSSTQVRNLRMLGAMYLEASPEVRYFLEVAPRYAGSIVNSLGMATQTRMWSLPAKQILAAIKEAISASHQDGARHAATYHKGREEWLKLTRGIGEARLRMAMAWLDRCEDGAAVPSLQL